MAKAKPAKTYFEQIPLKLVKAVAKDFQQNGSNRNDEVTEETAAQESRPHSRATIKA
jgi:hypothetical protein